MILVTWACCDLCGNSVQTRIWFSGAVGVVAPKFRGPGKQHVSDIGVGPWALPHTTHMWGGIHATPHIGAMKWG